MIKLNDIVFDPKVISNTCTLCSVTSQSCKKYDISGLLRRNGVI